METICDKNWLDQIPALEVIPFEDYKKLDCVEMQREVEGRVMKVTKLLKDFESPTHKVVVLVEYPDGTRQIADSNTRKVAWVKEEELRPPEVVSLIYKVSGEDQVHRIYKSLDSADSVEKVSEILTGFHRKYFGRDYRREMGSKIISNGLQKGQFAKLLTHSTVGLTDVGHKTDFMLPSLDAAKSAEIKELAKKGLKADKRDFFWVWYKNNIENLIHLESSRFCKSPNFTTLYDVFDYVGAYSAILMAYNVYRESGKDEVFNTLVLDRILGGKPETDDEGKEILTKISRFNINTNDPLVHLDEILQNYPRWVARVFAGENSNQFEKDEYQTRFMEISAPTREKYNMYLCLYFIDKIMNGKKVSLESIRGDVVCPTIEVKDPRNPKASKKTKLTVLALPELVRGFVLDQWN